MDTFKGVFCRGYAQQTDNSLCVFLLWLHDTICRNIIPPVPPSPVLCYVTRIWNIIGSRTNVQYFVDGQTRGNSWYGRIDLGWLKCAEIEASLAAIRVQKEGYRQRFIFEVCIRNFNKSCFADGFRYLLCFFFAGCY